VLVRKTYPERRNRSRHRKWKLRRLQMEKDDAASRRSESKTEDGDFEQFMQDIEEDPELQTQVWTHPLRCAHARKLLLGL
jgi:nonsense-mediated mRNA decay protein 3